MSYERRKKNKEKGQGQKGEKKSLQPQKTSSFKSIVWTRDQEA
jgi:hypothetical protein